jgi:hypothetical protein
MTILQIILFITHGFLGYLCYNWGRADGNLQGRRAVRSYYEQQQVGR